MQCFEIILPAGCNLVCSPFFVVGAWCIRGGVPWCIRGGVPLYYTLCEKSQNPHSIKFAGYIIDIIAYHRN